jgi:hypothetical protein
MIRFIPGPRVYYTFLDNSYFGTCDCRKHQRIVGRRVSAPCDVRAYNQTAFQGWMWWGRYSDQRWQPVKVDGWSPAIWRPTLCPACFAGCYRHGKRDYQPPAGHPLFTVGWWGIVEFRPPKGWNNE